MPEKRGGIRGDVPIPVAGTCILLFAAGAACFLAGLALDTKHIYAIGIVLTIGGGFLFAYILLRYGERKTQPSPPAFSRAEASVFFTAQKSYRSIRTVLKILMFLTTAAILFTAVAIAQSFGTTGVFADLFLFDIPFLGGCVCLVIALLLLWLCVRGVVMGITLSDLGVECRGHVLKWDGVRALRVRQIGSSTVLFAVETVKGRSMVVFLDDPMTADQAERLVDQVRAACQTSGAEVRCEAHFKKARVTARIEQPGSTTSPDQTC